ncbi:unnamed protein product [Strongylus vulgaris]|uniref:Uncharacterized protein n=1 Tax=Strongylus vulgaris TaxID=40348 RepID=A0A3P7LQW9_STRVU|nr:unnamed protein product [Strongylus vulgaris]
MEDEDLLPDKDSFDDKPTEGFIKQQAKERVAEPVEHEGNEEVIQAGAGGNLAAHCYRPKVEEQFLEKCRGYNEDCRQFQAQVDTVLLSS